MKNYEQLQITKIKNILLNFQFSSTDLHFLVLINTDKKLNMKILSNYILALKDDEPATSTAPIRIQTNASFKLKAAATGELNILKTLLAHSISVRDSRLRFEWSISPALLKIPVQDLVPNPVSVHAQ